MFNLPTIAILLLSTTLAFGCDANCIVCHPNLIKNGKIDKEHQILKRCTNCHKENKGGSSHSACGSDCWDCHSVQKVSKIDVQEHKVLPSCIECHSKLKSGFDLLDSKHSNQFDQTSLSNAIKKGI